MADREILLISLSNVYTDYKVGDSYLNDNDTTTLSITFDNSDKEEYLLKNVDEYSELISLSMKKGDIFTESGRKTITIWVINDNTKYVQYELIVQKSTIDIYSEKRHIIKAVYISKDLYNGISTFSVSDGSTSSGDIINPIITIFDYSKYMDKYLLVKDEIYPSDYIYSDLRNRSIIENVDGINVIRLSEETSLRKIIDMLFFYGYIVGYLEDINDTSKNAKVILFNDYTPPLDGNSNITVKFPCYVEGNADKINNCKFGIMFGNNNAKNRLFVSGNSSAPNCDWHTGEINNIYEHDENLLNGNFGYFEDDSYMFYGETDNKIVGYDIVSNDKLLVLKSESDKEKTVYFRTSTLMTATDSSGSALIGIDGNTVVQEAFPLSKGNNSIAGISPQSIVNLNGDCIFITNENTLSGLDLVGIVGDNQRYANTRSLYIDGYLKNKDLSNAWLWTNNKELLLMLEDEIFMTHKNKFSDNQYDWFRMDIPNVTSIIEIDKVRYFGTSDGHILKQTNKYEDIDKIFVKKGGFKIDEDSNVIINTTYINQLDLAKKYYFRVHPSTAEENYIYCGFARFGNIEGANFIVNSEHNSLELINNNYLIEDVLLKNKAVYVLKNFGPTNEFEYNKKYFLKKYTANETILEKALYKIYDEEDNEITLSALIGDIWLGFKLDEECEVSNIDLENSSVRLKYDGIELDCLSYTEHANVSDFNAEIICKKKINLYHIMSPLFRENIGYYKTIWSLAFTNDSKMNNEIEVTYTNNKIPYSNSKTLVNINDSGLGLNFNNLHFKKLSFEKNLVPRVYNHARVIPKVKFLCIGFKNSSEENSILCPVEIIYSTASPSR